MHLRSQLPAALLAAVTVTSVLAATAAHAQGSSSAIHMQTSVLVTPSAPAAVRVERRASVGALWAARNQATTAVRLAQLQAEVSRSRRAGIARSAVATSAPTTVPVFTQPSDGATVSGSITLTVTSSAAVVRFTDDQGLSQNVPVAGGTASWTLDTFGRSEGSHTEWATDCDSSGNCATSSARVVIQVDNGPLTITSPSADSTVGSSFVAAAASSGGAITFLVDGNPVGTAATPPYQLTVDTSALTTGAHTLVAERCASNQVDCGTRTDPVSFTVARVSPSITSVSPASFSPNGDGRRDTTTVTYSLDSAQRVTWSVTTPAGATVRGPVSLGRQGAGQHTFTFNGLDNARTPLASGGYVISIDTSQTANGLTVTGHTERGVVVDVTPPGLGSRHASPATVYPVHDGYKDSTRLTARANEALSALRAEVFNGAGRRVRVLYGTSGGPGLRYVTWNGRTAGGSLVPAGRYTFRFVARDTDGNQTTTGRSAVVVSAKKLVKQSSSKTVSPYGNVNQVAIGDCSEVIHPARTGAAWKGSLGYLSDFDVCADPADYELVASTRHAVTLPSAVKYGNVAVSAYGARSVPGYNDSGFILYEDANGDITSRGGILRASEAWHAASGVSATNFLQGRTFRWWAGATNGNFYDIRSFKVSYTYYVLR